MILSLILIQLELVGKPTLAKFPLLLIEFTTDVLLVAWTEYISSQASLMSQITFKPGHWYVFPHRFSPIKRLIQGRKLGLRLHYDQLWCQGEPCVTCRDKPWPSTSLTKKVQDFCIILLLYIFTVTVVCRFGF